MVDLTSRCRALDFTFAPSFNYPQNAVLQGTHHGIGPQSSIGIEICRLALSTRQVKQDGSVSGGLKAILPIEHIEVATADRDVLIKGGAWYV